MSLPVAMQLFSVRDDMSARPLETLRALKKYGYDGVEPAGLYGLSPEYFKGACDALELNIISAHVPYSVLADDTDKTIDIYKYLGCRYIAVPYLSADRVPGGENYAETVSNLRIIGKKAKDAGMQLLYHNHAHEFTRVNGDFALDTIYNCVSEEILKAEIDTGWVHYSKVDPSEYIKSYSGRVPVVHLKDYTVYDKKTKDIVTCPFGSGCLDAEKILAASVDSGAEWLVVEQDRPYKTKSAMKCAEISRKNLKKLGF